MKPMYVYVLASRSRVLYIGVTDDLYRRMWEHRTGVLGGFSAKYRVDRLVYFESVLGPGQAIAREKQLKSWRREKKVQLIECTNPEWRDLSKDWTDAPLPDPSLRSG